MLTQDWSPLPPAQRRLWFLHQLDPQYPAYHVCLAVDLRGRAHLPLLRELVRAVERRHPALRQRFAAHAGRAVGRITPAGPVPLRLVDLPPGPSTGVAVGDLLHALACRPFDLAAGPPAHWTVLRCGPEQHVLVLGVHHAVFDGGSVPVLVAELEALGAALTAGVPEAPLAPTPAGPEDSEPEDADGGPVADRAHVAYWRRVLADPPPPLDLWPADREPAAGVRTAVPAAEAGIGGAVLAAVRRLARDQRCTPHTVLLAALAVLLHRCTGREDLVIGTPIGLRHTPEDQLRIGLRLNLLPLRLRLHRELGFGAVLRAARDGFLDAIDHREVPFEAIVDAAGPERRTDLTPLFQVLFTAAEQHPAPRLPGVATSLLTVPAPAAKYDLEVTEIGAGDDLRIRFETDPRRCSAAAPAALAGYFTALLQAAVRFPELPVGRLPLTTAPAPRAVLARRASRTAAAGCAQRGAGLADLVRSTARSRPDAVAVRGLDSQITYGGIERRSAALAAQLCAAGVVPESVVAVCLPRTVDLPAAMLAAGRVAAAYLPLDPQLPEGRLRALLRDGQAAVLIATGDTASRCGFAGPVIRTDLQPPAPTAAGPVPGDPGQAAHVLYTSGSTGQPKAAMLTRAGVAGLMRWAGETYHRDELAETLAVTSAGFDLAVFELFAPLVHGGAVVLVDGPQDLARHPAAAHATLLNTVPSVLETLLDAGALPASLRVVNVAGEPLSAGLVARVRAALPAAAIRNLYGPTEATTYVTATGPLDGTRPPPIGRALGGARLRVVDDAGVDVPAGVSGELLIGGTPLARGYLGRPGLTAAAFGPDATPSAAGSRVYRTGDRVRRGTDGQLHFLGRRDHQVKLRGVRIELGEIEAVLRGHTAVRDAAVLVRGATVRDRRLVGCVATGARAAVDPGELAAWLRVRLPEVMVPREWVIAARLPLTRNGKIDRAQLACAAPAVAVPAVAPRSALERVVADAWSAVLGRPVPGVHDGFFDLGGNSLTLLLLHAALRERVDPDLRLVDLFRCPTVAAQAALLAVRGGGASPCDGPAALGQARALARRAARGGRARDRGTTGG